MSPPPFPRRTFAAIAILLFLSGCQPGQNGRPVPSVAQIGGDLKCVKGDHGFEDLQAGWGFCYPGPWRYIERSEGSQSPPGLDLTFDITNIPCSTPSSSNGQPVCASDAGLFAFMIISTYERGAANDLASWEQANLAPQPPTEPITWGNAVEAARMADGRRIALTPHHVVIMVLRSGAGLLDLEAEMSARLDTWKFSY